MTSSKITSRKKILLYFILVPILFIFSLAIVAIKNSVDNGSYYKAANETVNTITVIMQKQHWGKYNSSNIPQLLANRKIYGYFTAQANNLGIIAVPFDTHNKSINDKILFRLKEVGSNMWYSQNIYNVNQIQTDIPFPFGFPVIKNSKGKSFTFEIKSLTGTSNNSISLSKANFYFINQYKFSKYELIKNPYVFSQFIYYKIINSLPSFTVSEIIFIFFISFSPIIAYLTYRSLISLNKKYPQLLHFLNSKLFDEKEKFENNNFQKNGKIESRRYLYGIDYLRVIFCISVVMWHEVNKNSPLPNNSATTLSQYLTGFFHLDFVLLSVPGFLLISCFLFLYKGATLERLKSNIKHLLLLFFFWTIITNLLVGDLKDPIFLLSPHNLIGLYTLVTGGTFGIYYFLISLIITQILTYLIKNFKLVYICVGLIVSLITVLFLSYNSEITGNTLLIQYFSPISFIAVPFFSVILYAVYKFVKVDIKKIILFSIIFLFSGIIIRIIEWYFLIHLFFIKNMQPGFPIFARSSLYPISAFLIIATFFVQKKPPVFITVISRYSLAIYVTHLLFMPTSRQLTQIIIFPAYLHVTDLVITLICVALAMTFSKLFSLFIKREILFA